MLGDSWGKTTLAREEANGNQFYSRARRGKIDEQ